MSTADPLASTTFWAPIVSNRHLGVPSLEFETGHVQNVLRPLP